MDTEYEKQIKASRDRIAACQSACMTIAVSVGIIERELIHDRVPGEVEAGSADIVEAGSHARVTCAEIDSLSEHAAAAAKGLAKASKDLEFVARAGRRLFTDLLARADAEEQRRREEEDERREREAQRQQGLPFEEPTSSPGLVEQTAAAALPVWLAMARDLAREDAPKGIRSSDAESLAITLELPPELTPHTAVVFLAYEETWEATEPKKKRKK